MKTFYIPVIVILFTSLLTADAQEKNDTIAEIDALFSDWNNQTPGASLTIKKGEELKYQKAYGMADLEHGVRNTTETIFEAGSVSKQFTAAAVLLLASEGKVDLDADVREYIPELPVYDEVITVRHLIHHTSGLKDWGSVASIGGWTRTTRVYTNDYALDYIFRQKGLNYSPGEEYLYSNSNYTLLVAIAERVSEQALPDFTRERFFEPLGMNNTKWRDNFREVVPGRALGYNKSSGEYITVMPFENTYGHAALLTTTEDLIKWNEAWLRNEIGEADLSELRILKGRLSNGQDISYAAAVFVNEVNGVKEISHSGATAGYRAWLSYYPQEDLSVAYLSNDGSIGPATIGRKVAEIFLGKEKSEVPELHARTISADDLQDKEGVYRNLKNHELVKLTLEDERLHLNNNKLHALASDTLFRNNTKYIFEKDKVSIARTNDPDDLTVYKRVAVSNPDSTTLEQFTGAYSSDEAVSLINIENQDGTLYAILTPSRKEKLNPSFKDAFQVRNSKLYEFARDDQGNINGLYISVARAEDIFFEKIE